MTTAEMKQARQRAGLTEMELAHLFRLQGKNGSRTIRRIESQAATGPKTLFYELLYSGRLADYVLQILVSRER